MSQHGVDMASIQVEIEHDKRTRQILADRVSGKVSLRGRGICTDADLTHATDRATELICQHLEEVGSSEPPCEWSNEPPA